MGFDGGISLLHEAGSMSFMRHYGGIGVLGDGKKSLDEELCLVFK